MSHRYFEVIRYLQVRYSQVLLYMNWIDGHDLKSMAFCNVCQKAFDISNMGEAALKSHAKGAKHVHALKEKLELTKNSKISDFVVQASTSTTARPVACTSGSIVSKESDSERTGTVGLSAFVTNDNVLKAEILWTLKVVTSHFSFNSSLKVPWLFQSMFPDSLIATKMTMSERKCAYFEEVEVLHTILSFFIIKRLCA